MAFFQDCCRVVACDAGSLEALEALLQAGNPFLGRLEEGS